jgi:hypothetical protein
MHCHAVNAQNHTILVLYIAVQDLIYVPIIHYDT